jgi:hypothetical protein
VAGVAARADPTPDRLGEVADENDIEILGPPGAMP